MADTLIHGMVWYLQDDKMKFSRQDQIVSEICERYSCIWGITVVALVIISARRSLISILAALSLHRVLSSLLTEASHIICTY